ncbi:amino acid permease-domain-containing protein [Lasiosphaeria hispida]|uniref:Amino acid permease-domain-containing protein n=1 Tax=Lasiosphaeria hispida TaxID=260671 RepID=A0AAJ0MF05_9PEZI|nr:amino acid permease-domain-containing protein [Lasiosphaeria hispida]
MATQQDQNTAARTAFVVPGAVGRTGRGGGALQPTSQAPAAAGIARSGPAAFQSNLAAWLQQTTNPNAILTKAPREHYRLSFFDVSCLIINRMIGTGIFNSPKTVILGTKSAGSALILWFFGALYSLAGTHVYIEYGLNVPRYVIEGNEQAVPRSGGDLHYLSFVYNWPYYKKGTVLYSACLYGISFICVGNMAGNCVNFAIRVLLASNPAADLDYGQVRGIACAAAFFSCIIHAVSRRGGILLNNLLATVKVCILLVIPLATFAVLGGAIKDPNGAPVPNVFPQNMHPSVAFQPPKNFSLVDTPIEETLESGTVNGYAAAFLSIIFAYGGFEQSNYVLGEIKSPRRTFPRAATFAVALVALLYMFANISYMAVVPAHEQPTKTVALLFFQKVFSRSTDDTRPDRIFNSFLALSSFGNIIVTTYTAARMKQEIAKQGFIPYSRFFAQNTDVSIGRLVLYLREKGWKVPFFASPEQHHEATPVGALALHLGACLVLIWSTYSAAPGDAYGLLSSLSAYLITAFFGFFLALGILILRVFGPPAATESAKTEEYRATHSGTAAAATHGLPVRLAWREMTGRSVHGWLSIAAATLYLLGNAFPVIASWVPNTARFSTSAVPSFVVPTVCWVILGVASLWWLGFLAVGRYRRRHQHKTLVHEVWPEFDWAEPAAIPNAGHHGDDSSQIEKRQRGGGKILVHETVLFTWEVDEMGHFSDGDGAPDRSAALNMPAPMPGLPVGVRTQPGPMAAVPGRRRPAEPQPPPEDDLAGTGFEDFDQPTWNDAQTGNSVNVPWR